MCTVEGVAAPSGRCLRSGHKNSVKGKGAIKHKGAPTIIYHCTDAPFRLAPLATHPLSGGGQEKWRRGRLTQNLASPLLAVARDHEVVEGGCLKAVDACEAGVRTLSKERVPSNIKRQVNQTTHLAGRQPAASCPIQLFQHIKHPLTGRAFHVFTACSEETPMQIESAFLRILMHCCVMELDMNESSLA